MMMDTDTGASAEMPRYRCHKKVWALQIADISGLTILPRDVGYAAFDVDEDFIRKHKPQVGGYYVVYDDGYKSFSPAKAFEEGYTRI